MEPGLQIPRSTETESLIDSSTLTLTLKVTLTLAHNWAVHMYELTRNSRYFGYPNPIVSALRDLPNIAQLVKGCAINKLISGAARLVKCAIDLMQRYNYSLLSGYENVGL